MTLHGSQFRNAAVIVASPPCQRYSYMAMPWKLSKVMIARYEKHLGDLNDLFNACFRIQREASEAAGHHIPMVVENVCGAQRWVGRAAWHFGSYYLWGDVPALMPPTLAAQKVPSFRFDGSGRSFKTAAVNSNRRTAVGKGNRFTSYSPTELEGLKFGGGWWHDSTNNLIRKASSRSSARKAASAQIAKIPFPLAQYIARAYKPREWAEAQRVAHALLVA